MSPDFKLAYVKILECGNMMKKFILKNILVRMTKMSLIKAMRESGLCPVI